MSKLLINEPPLQVLPTLACYIGLNESLFLQQVHYWLQNQKIGKEVDGRKWVRNSMTEWEEQFPFWSKNVIRRTIKNLIDDGLLAHRDDLNQAGYDRTSWYSINYDKLDAVKSQVTRMQKKSKKRKQARAARADDSVTPVQNVPPPVQDVTPVQNVPPKGTKCTPQRYKMYPTIPETPTETPTETHIARGADDGLEIAWGMSLELCNNDQPTAAAVWQLQNHFLEVSKCVLPDVDTEHGRKDLLRDWWPHLLDFLVEAGGVDAAKQAISTAVTDQREWKPASVSTPKSIRKKTLAAISGAKWQQEQPLNGRASASDLAQYQVSQFGM